MVVTKTHAAAAAAPWRIAVVALAFGTAVGYFLGWQHPPRTPDPDAATATVRSGPFADGPGTDLNLELATLHLDLPEDSVQSLQAARDRAIARGAIEQEAADTVAATVRLEADGEDPRPLAASVRLKGDMLDHIDTDKWSMRIELEDGKRLGMRRFSIQHPKTRGFMAEWLVMTMARAIELLAPRGRFVEVTINGRPNGVYYLEEHLGKEMLEAQGRRDGPIVRFREDTLWSAWIQHDFLRGANVPDFVNAATTSAVAEIDVYERSRLARTPALAARMARAIEQMRAMQDLLIAGMPHYPGAADAPITPRLDAMDRLAGVTLDDLCVTDRVGDMLAIATLWAASHGLGWHQWRFYHDGVRDRLEPVLFDMGVEYQALIARQGILLAHPALHDLTRSGAVRDRAFRTLWRIADPKFIDAFFAAIEPEYAAIRRAFAADPATVPASMDAAAVLQAFETALRGHAAFVRSVIAPTDAANFACRLVGADGPDDGDRLTFELDAWTTTQAPVIVDGFRFGNGHFVAARDVLDGAPRGGVKTDTGGVTLPRWSRRQRFVLPADLRLVGLRRIQELKRAIRAARSAGGGETNIDLSVEYRILASGEARSEALRVLRIESSPDAHRPTPPELAALLEQQPCLRYEPERDRLSLRAGDWTIADDLVLPAGRALFCGPGVRLRFGPGRVFACDGALDFRGAERAPIVLESSAPDSASWGGLIATDVDEDSVWEHVVVRHAAGFDRGGWQSSGGVTFYHAPITMRDCRIEDARGEDALNVFGTRCTLERCSFAGGPSDLFDGDFVRGTASQCLFADSGEDAVDVSGSTFTVVDCRFIAIGDKAVSVGERSNVEISGARIGHCSIAVAAKDASSARITDLHVDAVEQFGLCAFIKKLEFGPSSIVADGVVIDAPGKGVHLVQTGCSLVLDGQTMPTQDLDVPQLYADKVLGK